MEEALQQLDIQPQPLEIDQQPKGKNNFAVGIAASIALHLVATIVLLGLPQGPESRSSVTYIDLALPNTVKAPPMTAPAVKAPPKPAPKPEEPAAEEKEPIPPKESAQTEQPKEAPQQPAPLKEAKVEEPTSHSTLGLGLTRGFFNSLNNGETLQPAVKEYYLAMLQGINEKWWLDQEVDKGRINPMRVDLTIARNGTIVNIQIISGSGNFRYDRAVVAAITAASPLPPLPQSYQYEYFLAPLKLVPPLNLMAW